jgi:hypothetical protein
LAFQLFARPFGAMPPPLRVRIPPNPDQPLNQRKLASRKQISGQGQTMRNRKCGDQPFFALTALDSFAGAHFFDGAQRLIFL